MITPDVPSILLGTGGTLTLGGWIIRYLVKEKADLILSISEANERERKLTADVLEALILTRNFQENHRNELNNLGSSVAEELSQLTETINRLANELENNTQAG